jgi:hypothetical protein
MDFKRIVLYETLTAHAGMASAARELSVIALFRDKALVEIDGQQRLLIPGTGSPEGIRLVSADKQRGRDRDRWPPPDLPSRAAHRLSVHRQGPGDRAHLARSRRNVCRAGQHQRGAGAGPDRHRGHPGRHEQERGASPRDRTHAPASRRPSTRHRGSRAPTRSRSGRFGSATSCSPRSLPPSSTETSPSNYSSETPS